jgi:succinate dehydrogenase/fumarate reductase flavoprotein subunit
MTSAEPEPEPETGEAAETAAYEGAEELWETDVVVVGAGPAGMAATAAAVAAGARVVVIEALERIGGNAVWSNGYLAFVDSEAQRAAGIGDGEEVFVADARRAFEGVRDRFGVVWDEPMVRLFARESAHTHRILTQRGVRFSRFVSRPAQHSVDRMLAVDDPGMFATAFAPEFRSPRVRTLCGVLADRLITENARVVGVRAHRRADQRPVTVRATRGIVLTTGGYQANPQLRRRFQPEARADTPYLGIDSCRGAGHLLGQAVGGDLVNMTFVPPMVIVASTVVEDAIAVNTAGRRFHDETTAFDTRVQRLRAQPDQRAWYVFDAQVARRHVALINQMPQPPVRADTLADLAATIGVPSESLAASVAVWNEFLASRGAVDPEFGRRVLPPGRRGCATSPFYAVPMVEGINFCCGGFRTTTGMQVVDVFGAPIPGLFAAGDCAAGLNCAAEIGGLHISGGFTLGRLAGHTAATASTPSTPDGADSADSAHLSLLHSGLPSRLTPHTALAQPDTPLRLALS